MKQIITKFPNGSICRKYYENNRGQRHGLFIYYWSGGNVGFKSNYINNQEYGLRTEFYGDGKIEKQIYNL